MEIILYIYIYKLNDYKYFNSFIKIKELNNISNWYQIKTLNDDDYIDLYKLLEKYKKDDFKNKIKTNDFNIEEGIDNFYVASYNFSLSNNVLSLNFLFHLFF